MKERDYSRNLAADGRMIWLDFKEEGCKSMKWIQLAQDRVHWQVLVETTKISRFYKRREISWPVERLSSFQEWLSPIELVNWSVNSVDSTHTGVQEAVAGQGCWWYRDEELRSHCPIDFCALLLWGENVAGSSVTNTRLPSTPRRIRFLKIRICDVKLRGREIWSPQEVIALWISVSVLVSGPHDRQMSATRYSELCNAF
jgi:hypothetical protein